MCMKYLLIFSLILFTHSFLHAQNLVPNYSFEQADSCPIYLNDRNFEYSLGCVGWGQANTNTSDYYNACDTYAISIGMLKPIVSVPYNIWGFQPAFDGVAYTGICMYDSTLNYYKEYLISNIPTLEIDTVYKVIIHVSLADSSQFATDAFGVLFTTYGSPNQYNNQTINIEPQIDYSNYGVISDTVNWKTLAGTFIADSEYKNIIIGGFKNYSKMNILDINNAHKTTANAAYYFVDDIIVEKLSTTGITSHITIAQPIIYPNPFTDHATIIFSNQDQKNCSLTIFNSQSQVVEHIDNINSDRIRIERNGLPSGFYYYQLRNNNNIIANGKMIIES